MKLKKISNTNNLNSIKKFKMSPNFKIDSHGACFLCLSSKNCLFFEENENGEVNNSPATAIKMIFRYLKVDVIKTSFANMGHVFNFNNPTNRNLSVTLCDDCASVANDFLEMFQVFENIRLQLDLCVLQLHEFMEKGGKDPDRVREYENRMNNGKLDALINTKIVECLRKETMEKVSRNVNSSSPRISLENCGQTLPEHLNGNGAASPITEDLNSDSSDCEIVAEHPATEMFIVDEPASIISGGDGSSSVSDDDVCRMDVLEDNAVELGPSSQLAEPEPTLGEQFPITHQLEMCSYCDDENCYFSSKNSLENHLYNKHPFEVLSNGGLIPPNVSEQQLNRAADKMILEQVDSSFECHLCRQTGFFQSRSQMITHLFRYHLDDVLKNVEDTRRCAPNQTPLLPTPTPQPPPPTENAGLYSPISPPSEYWNCIPCRLRFSQKAGFYAHLIYNHPASAFKSRLPSGTSDQDFNSAVAKIISESMKITGDGGDIRRCVYECLLCGTVLKRIDHLKLHVVCSHVDQVIQAVSHGRPGVSSNGKFQQETRPWNSVVSGGPSTLHEQTNFPHQPTTNSQLAAAPSSLNHQIGTFLSQNQIGTWGFLIPNQNFVSAEERQEKLDHIYT